MQQEKMVEAETSLSTLELSDLINITALQEMLDVNFYNHGIGVGIIDLEGKVLACTGSAEVRTRFSHPKTNDQIVTPIKINNRHMGNILLEHCSHHDLPHFNKKNIQSVVKFNTKLASLISKVNYQSAVRKKKQAKPAV